MMLRSVSMKNVMLLTGAGQIGMAIARRVGYGMKIVIGDKRRENAEAIADTMNKALDTAENTATTASSNQWMPMD